MGRVAPKLKLNHARYKGGLHCEHYRDWNGIPIFKSSQTSNISAITGKDGESLIVVGDTILKLYTDAMLESAFWHEVSHLYFKDHMLRPAVEYEYRADMVAAYATSAESVIRSLETSKQLYEGNSMAMDLIEIRIRLLGIGGYDLDILPKQMLAGIKGVTVVYG